MHDSAFGNSCNEQECATDNLRDGMSYLRQTATNAMQAGKDHLEGTRLQLEDRIRTQPLRAMFLAAGVSFVVGAFWARR